MRLAIETSIELPYTFIGAVIFTNFTYSARSFTPFIFFAFLCSPVFNMTWQVKVLIAVSVGKTNSFIHRNTVNEWLRN